MDQQDSISKPTEDHYVISLDNSQIHSANGVKTHTENPLRCQWAAHGLSMGNFPCKWGCPLLVLSYMETVDNSVGSPLLQIIKKLAAQWAAEWTTKWAAVGILPCKWGCPLFPYIETVGRSVGSRVCCPWEFFHTNEAVHYFHIRIKWAAQWATGWAAHYFKYWSSGQLSGQTTELPTIKLKMEVIFKYLHCIRCFPSLRNEKRRCCYTVIL